MTEPHFEHRIAAAVAPVGRLLVRNPFDLTPIATVDQVDQVGVEQALMTDTQATDPRVAFFSFIGSARVGWRLRSRLAPAPAAP
jgi:hypothetical protein